MSAIKNEIELLKTKLLNLDKKVLFIIISAVLIQTISHYYGSRIFFREHLYSIFVDNSSEFAEYIYWLSSRFLIQFLLPILLIVLVLKDKPSDYGVRLGEWKPGLIISAVFTAVMLPILWIASDSPGFLAAYPHASSVRYNWELFAVYEFCFILYMIGWEYIWKGYFLFGLEKKFGYYAILFQMIPFTILHFGKPLPETLGAVIAGIALGYLALRTRSFIYGVIIHFITMFTIDLLCTLRVRYNIRGIGLDAFGSIIDKIL